VAVGGAGAGSEHYSWVSKNYGLRKNFARSLYDFVLQYGFHGVDLAWEFPTENGGSPDDKVNFSLLMEEIRSLFAPAGLIMSASLTGNIEKAVDYYELEKLSM